MQRRRLEPPGQERLLTSAHSAASSHVLYPSIDLLFTHFHLHTSYSHIPSLLNYHSEHIHNVKAHFEFNAPSPQLIP